MLYRVLITGSNGLLGQKLVNLFTNVDGFEVFALSHGKNRNITAKDYSYYNIDITNTNKVKKLLNSIKPNYIINAAAITNVDQCEKEKKLCDKVNVEAVKTLVNFCKKNKSHLIHISTDFIFDGNSGPYAEDDKPNPINYYGLSKMRSEQLIIQANINYTLLRTILVYGIVDNMTRNNIVLFVKEALENGKEVTMVDDQYRMPTLVDDLAKACLLAIQRKAYGVFHISSNQMLSIYEMALQIAEVFELDNIYIKRIATNQLKQIAKRPIKTGFDLTKAKKQLGFPASTFKERLQVFKNQLIKSIS